MPDEEAVVDQQTEPSEATADTTDAEASEQQTVEGQEKETEPAEHETTVPYKRFSEVYGRMKELERNLVDLVKMNQAQPRQTQATPPVLPDFDTMTTGEAVRWIMHQMPGLIQQQVNPVVERTETDRVRRDIETAATAHPDFWDYREQMVSISERHPTLSAEEVYFLASGNQDAVKKSVTQRVNATMAKKRAARTETKSTPTERTTESKQYKDVREAGLAVARKLGLM